MKESNQVTSLLIASAICVLGVPVIASATPQGGSTGDIAIHVSYSDLDLSSDEGLIALYKRLQTASQAVCGAQHSVQGAGSIQVLLQNQRCYDQTLSRAVSKVGNPKLDAIHSG